MPRIFGIITKGVQLDVPKCMLIWSRLTEHPIFLIEKKDYIIVLRIQSLIFHKEGSEVEFVG